MTSARSVLYTLALILVSEQFTVVLVIKRDLVIWHHPKFLVLKFI
jgi:hypothetical protein